MVLSGTDSYRDLCISDGEYPSTIWDRPGPGGPNRTDIWSHTGGGGGDGTGDGWDMDGGLFGNGTDSWGPGGVGPGVIPGQMEVNECAAFPGLCGHGRCRNMLGGFTCDCFPGYEQVSGLFYLPGIAINK